MDINLTGRVCIVTGASRGIGKGIAIELCKAGAKVYITGRTLGDGGSEGGQSLGSLLRTAREASIFGGECIPVQCDHRDDGSTEAVFEQVKRENMGRLDCLVNNAYQAADTMPMGMKFYEKPLELWDTVHNVGLRSHYVASVFAARQMAVDVSAPCKCIINISSAAGLKYLFDVSYGVGKAAVDRLAADMAVELKEHSIACVSLWPGAVKTEYLASTDFKVGGRQLEIQNMETPEFTGRAVVALLGHPEKVMQWSGEVMQCSEVAMEFGLWFVCLLALRSSYDLKGGDMFYDWHCGLASIHHVGTLISMGNLSSLWFHQKQSIRL